MLLCACHILCNYCRATQLTRLSFWVQEHVQSTASALLEDRDKLAELAKGLTVQPFFLGLLCRGASWSSFVCKACWSSACCPLHFRSVAACCVPAQRRRQGKQGAGCVGELCSAAADEPFGCGGSAGERLPAQRRSGPRAQVHGGQHAGGPSSRGRPAEATQACQHKAKAVAKTPGQGLRRGSIRFYCSRCICSCRLRPPA